MNLADFILSSQVAVGYYAKDKERLLLELAGQAGHALKLAPKTIATALLQREQLGTTGTGCGIAMPHARVSGLVKPFAMLVRLKPAIDFDAVDGELVDVVGLLLLPENPRGGWLNELACFAQSLRDISVVRSIREARDNWEAYRALLGDFGRDKSSQQSTFSANPGMPLDHKLEIAAIEHTTTDGREPHRVPSRRTNIVDRVHPRGWPNDPEDSTIPLKEPELLTALKRRLPTADASELRNRLTQIQSALRAAELILPDGKAIKHLTANERAAIERDVLEAGRFLNQQQRENTFD
jgi:nitrogen PTS system EIIA component